MIKSDLIKNRLLVIGSNGMLGQRLVEYFSKDQKIELKCASAENESFIPGVDYTQLDIRQKNNVREIILDFFPDFVINAAAFTNVDKSESERETAWKINVTGVENIALYSWTIDAHLIHISTDYIFDGKNGPYSESDKPNPIGYYGRTKLAGENSIRTSGVRFTILRTNILYGPVRFGRPDFVKWVIDSLRSNKEIRIVTDQIGNPTFIDDIVASINKIIESKKEGIYNIAGKETLSRYDFTIRIAKYFGLDEKLIMPILTDELRQPAPRPLKSGLLTLKAETEIGFKPRPIESAFALIKKELDI
ncbi:MAG: dTDP-4-dehydrorhamnose reductase [Ignavibacteriae bacterium HGW-Ignavibacteriae-3]|nr:MAG: dTDP-4-dehydrorhamnose reductase [Ignavibacteriae bacterium HGW-Ignavibacteriae-3]